MVSDRLVTIVRCPDCRQPLTRRATDLACDGCGRTCGPVDRGFLDLRPSRAFAETTKYTDEALHTDARHEQVSPPLLAAGVRNDMLRRFLRPAPSDRVVDLGCGSGRMALWNRDLGAWTVGVDVSPFFATEALARVDLVLGDLRELPFPDGTFTKAYALDVLEHLSPQALADMLREASRVLAPGGALFVYTHVRKNSPLALGLRGINALARWLESVGALDMTQERLRKSDHLNPIRDIPELHDVVGRAGFRIERIRYYTPLIGGFTENIVMRVAERTLARRAARRLAAAGTAATDLDAAAVKEARTSAKARLARGGPLLAALRGMTWLMKADILLFGRIRSGPFFALLVKDGSGPPRPA